MTAARTALSGRANGLGGFASYEYGKSRRELRPVVANEQYDPRDAPAETVGEEAGKLQCGREIRSYGVTGVKVCARRTGHPGPCRPRQSLAQRRRKRGARTDDGRCRECGYLAGSPSCRVACGEAA